MKYVIAACAALLIPLSAAYAGGTQPYVVVLGVAQDGGVPQAGSDAVVRVERKVVSLAVVEPETGRRWLFDCSPDFPEQLRTLDAVAPVTERPGLAGIFLTHAHVGHYTGLMYLGHEVMGASDVPVYAMPTMSGFLKTNGPWSQLVRYKNIALRELEDGVAVTLGSDLRVIPLRVPHRQEYSEVVGYRIDGPNRSVLFIPDIDSWREWDDQGTRIEDLIRDVDVAYLDGTFYANGEIPGRDMSAFPHPFITTSMDRFATLPAGERSKVRFIHFNHTNPALVDTTEARRTIVSRGYRVAEELERVDL